MIITLKDIVAEDFVQYKKPSMFLVSRVCDWKCCKDAHIDYSVCQNNAIVQMPDKHFKIKDIFDLYVNNPITKALVIGGLEPMLQFDQLYNLISYFREHGCEDDIVIYTGYNESEIPYHIKKLSIFKNIIIKFGRYVPNRESVFDDVLGVTLQSNNQYARVIV